MDGTGRLSRDLQLGSVGARNPLVWQAQRLAVASRDLVARHFEKRKTDSAYREGVDLMIDWLARRPGRMGQAGQTLSEVHGLLARLL